jgi:hypothetical protein
MGRATYLGVALSQPPLRRDLQVMHPPRVQGVPDRRLRPFFCAGSVEAMMCAIFVEGFPAIDSKSGLTIPDRGKLARLVT